jgi:type II secretory pathway predicted ATPase ExeA
MNRVLTRKSFGLPSDPWSSIRIDTADAGRVADMCDAAVDDSYIIQIVGSTGVGKSTALRAALDARNDIDPKTDLIEVLRLDRESRTIADVVSAIYRQLGAQRPTRAEDRDAQLRMILGEATRRSGPTGKPRRLLLLLDDAHFLHWRTISAIKGLRELTWIGRGPALGIILLSQRDILGRSAEIRERSDSVHLAGPTADEAATALHRAFGQIIEAEAIEVLASGARTWNRLIWLSDQALDLASQDGDRTIRRAHAIRAVGRKLKDIHAERPIPLQQLANTTGASKGHISRVIAGKRQDADLSAALTDILLADQAGTEQPRAAGGAL